MKGAKAVVVLSGGQDSTTCLYWAQDMGYDVHAVTFDYGQKHVLELVAAKKVAEMADVRSHEIIRLGANILRGTSPLVNPREELQQYADHKSLPGGLEKTFVPMRNQLFLTLAANRAYVLGANTLVTGVCQADSGGYPDCREEFVKSFEQTSSFGTFTDEQDTLPPLFVETPLMYMTKAESVELALRLPGCYRALSYSHTAYDGQYPPVGKDHATLLREKGFVEANVPDPLVLRAWKAGLMSLPDLPNYDLMHIQQYLRLLE